MISKSTEELICEAAFTVENYLRLHGALPEDDSCHHDRFGRDESVRIELNEGPPFQAFIVAFMTGGVLLEVDDMKDGDPKDSAVMSRRFVPYHAIDAIKEMRRDVNGAAQSKDAGGRNS